MLHFSSPAQQDKQHSLFLSLMCQHKRTVLGGALIRLCLSVFTFSQPFLVQALLDYVRKGSSGTSAEGMWLIIAYAAVYTGIAACDSPFKYLVASVRHADLSSRYARQGTCTRLRDS